MTKKNIAIISFVIVVVILSIVVLNSSQSDTPKLETNATTQNIESKTSTVNFETIATVQDLYTRLNQKNPNEILIDVRTPEEFKLEHIQNAVNTDMENPNFKSEVLKLDKSKTYIVFCRSGNRSLTASKIMANEGLKVINSSEGITAWIEAKLPVVK